MDRSEKQRIRRELSARRLGLSPEEAAAAGRSAAEHLLEREEIRAAPAVGIYWAHRGELPTEALFRGLKAAGKKIFLPRIEAKGDRLVFAPFESEGELEPGPFGVLEPRGGATLEAGDLPVLVLPGLAFDLAGGRIGWGQGYYDRVLRGYSGCRLALAYEFQVLAALPREAHDEAIHILVTEARSIEVRRAT
ncbi:MAG TPA: 5-formyltetrahydrofolate cyclo-ligase [bacterium]|nr:5-formyltetrahydrofolate cyclo-ligase [bacterium]